MAINKAILQYFFFFKQDLEKYIITCKLDQNHKLILDNNQQLLEKYIIACKLDQNHKLTLDNKCFYVLRNINL